MENTFTDQQIVSMPVTGSGHLDQSFIALRCEDMSLMA